MELRKSIYFKYALKLDEKDKYLEIINNIESFEQDMLTKNGTITKLIGKVKYIKLKRCCFRYFFLSSFLDFKKWIIFYLKKCIS